MSDVSGGPTGPVRGREFFKMSGSGNDFVFFDARRDPAGELAEPEAIRWLCARGTGIGADGVVFLEPPTSGRADFSIRYFNADGSLADLCGNASLCSVSLFGQLAGQVEELAFETGAGLLTGRLASGRPEIEVGSVARLDPTFDLALEPGERRIAFALVGVPHLAVLVDDVSKVDVAGRGGALRRTPSLSAGANVNFVSPSGLGWRIRTYERGVEAETLACGTGAVATAAALRSWGLVGDRVDLETRSGRALTVTLRPTLAGLAAALSGEGRLVFVGRLSDDAVAHRG